MVLFSFLFLIRSVRVCRLGSTSLLVKFLAFYFWLYVMLSGLPDCLNGESVRLISIPIFMLTKVGLLTKK